MVGLDQLNWNLRLVLHQDNHMQHISPFSKSDTFISWKVWGFPVMQHGKHMRNYVFFGCSFVTICRAPLLQRWWLGVTNGEGGTRILWCKELLLENDSGTRLLNSSGSFALVYMLRIWISTVYLSSNQPLRIQFFRSLSWDFAEAKANIVTFVFQRRRAVWNLKVPTSEFFSVHSPSR